MANSCDAILEHGIFNELRYVDISTFRSDVKRVLHMTREQSEHTSDGGNISVLWDLVNASGNGDVVKELKELYDFDESIAINSAAMKTLESRVVSKAIVEAWRDCNVLGGERVLNIYASAPNAPDTKFIVNLDYRPATEQHATKFDVTDVQVVNAQNVKGELRKGASLGAFSSLSLIGQRTGRAKVIVVVNVQGAGSLKAELPELPALLPPIPPMPPPLPTLQPTEVLVNGSGEENDGAEPPTGWTCVAPSGYNWHTNRTGRTNRAIDGRYLMWPGHHPGNYAELQQDIDLSGYAAQFIDKDRLFCNFEGWLGAWTDSHGDDSGIIIEVYDGSGNLITPLYETGRVFPANDPVRDERWQRFSSNNVLIPRGTRTLRVRLQAFYTSGRDTDSYFDGLSVKVHTP